MVKIIEAINNTDNCQKLWTKNYYSVSIPHPPLVADM